MSEDISVLGIAVETRGVKEGSDALDRLTVAGGKAEKSANTLGAESRKTSSEIAALAKSALAAGVAFASFSSIKSIAGSMIETADAMSLMAARIKLVTSSQAEFLAVQTSIASMAKENRAGISEMSALYSRLAAPIKEAGGGMKETIAIVDSFSKSLKIGGASAQEAAAATLQFAQAMGSGKLSGDEFRSLAEASPRFMKAIADSVGVPVGALKDMAAQGKLTADIVGNALISANASLTKEFATLPNTVGDAMTKVSNELKLVVDEINKASGATAGLAGSIGTLSSSIKPIGAILVEASKGMDSTSGSAGVMDAAIQGVRLTLETLLVVGSNVGHILTAMGREIGGTAAQIAALSKGDFAGFSAIGTAMKSDAEEARKAIDEYSDRILGAYEKTKSGSKQAASAVSSDTKASLRSVSAVQSYLADMSNAPKAVKIAAEIEKENGAFKSAIDSLRSTDKDYESALKNITKAHNERLAEIQKQPKGADSSKNDATQSFAARLSEEKDFTKTQIDLVKARVEQRVISEEDGIRQVLESQTAGFAAQQATLTAQLAATADKGDKLRISGQLKAIANDALLAGEAYKTAMAKIEQARQSYMNAQVESADNSAYKIEQDNVALREQIDIIGMSADQLGQYEAGKVRTAAAAEYLAASNLREAASTMEAGDATNGVIAYYNSLADAREAAGKALDAKSAMEAEKGIKKTAKEAADEWKKTADKIGDNITDALMRGFESGKGFAEAFRDTVANMFKTLILRPIIQATVVGGLSSVGLGSASAMASDMSSSGGLGSIGSLASGAKSAYDIFTGGASSTYNSMATSSLGQSLGLSNVGAIYEASSDTMFTGAQLTDLGSNIGTGLAAAGAGLIGSEIGNAIAGDKRIIAGISSSTIGATIGMIGGPLGAGIGGIVGGLFDAAFGMGEKEYTDKGIQGKFSGTSFSGNSYQNWEQEGGWFSGDDDGTETSPLDSKTSQALSTSFTMLKLETGRLAAGLGVDTASIAAYSKEINLVLTDDAAANTQAITDMIAGISEEMSAMVLAGTNFKLAGETSSETLSRLYNSLVTVNSAFESINISSYAKSLAGGDMASQLALLMGGIDSFKTSITSYYSTYFSAQEQQADLVKQTTESIKALGVAVPATKEGFRALIEGLDMTTAAGRTTFAGLMSVSAAFATMTDAAAAAAAAALKSATDLSASVAGDAYAALDRAVSAQKKALETAYTKQKNEWDIAVAAANEIKGTLTSLSSTLHSAVRSVVVESDSLSLSRRAEAQVTLNSAVVTSKSGGSLAPFSDAITSAIADLSAPSESLYASFEEYARAQGRANAALTELQNASDSQLSVADRTLKEIQSAADAAEAAYTKQLADLDETLSIAKLQLDATNGINTTVLTMSDALKALSASITDLALNRSLSGLPTGTGSSSTAINTAGVTAAYDKYLGTTGDKAGIAWQVAHIADGSNTLAQIVDNIANSADAQKKAINDAYVTYLGSNADSAGMAWQLAHIADGSNTLAQIVENIKNAGSSNSHAGGLERVPYDGYQATLHAGEAVVDANSTRAISRYFGGGGGNNNDAMVAELKALREEVNLLRYEARATATNTGKAAKTLDKFDNDGMPAERIAA